MALEDTITDVVEKLREGAFPNEQSVSQGIVLRVLSDLHWDVFENSVVWPEYATAGGGRADFALCEPRSKPKVLIEVKQPGKALEDARSEHRSKARRAQARQAIPDAWRQLVEQGDELLFELIGDAVESKEGVRPNDRDITGFLKSLSLSSAPSYRPSPVVPATEKSTQKEARESARNHSGRSSKARGVKTIRRETIGGEICFWIRERLRTEEILSKVKQKYPQANTTRNSVAYYRSGLKTGRFVLGE